MRRDITVMAQIRESRGKNAARRMRRAGMIPAVVYGAFQDAVSVTVNPKEISGVLHTKSGHNTIFNLDVQGKENTPVMVVDTQFDPIKGTLLHADLKRIDLSKRIQVKVPVVTAGEPIGVKTQGGLLEIVTREIEIECLPDEIPEHFTVDVAELLIGQSKRATDIPMTESMKLVSQPDSVIAHVVPLRTSEVSEAAPPPEAGAEAAAAEPEVIKKGKKEEEGEGEAKTKKK